MSDDDDDLFEWANRHTRKTDPDTSRDAALSARDLAKSHCGILYRTLLRLAVPLTSGELATAAGLDHAQAWRRMSDLKRKGLIHDSGMKGTNPNGRSAIKWEAVWPA